MGKLTAAEARTLKALQEKSEAPDAPPVSRSLSVSIDLGDEKQVERAARLGLLDLGDDDDDGDDDADADADDTPRRRGYFQD